MPVRLLPIWTSVSMSLRMADMDPKSDAYKSLAERYEKNFQNAYERYARVSGELPARADAMTELTGFIGQLKGNLGRNLAAAAAATKRRSPKLQSQHEALFAQLSTLSGNHNQAMQALLNNDGKRPPWCPPSSRRPGPALPASRSPRHRLWRALYISQVGINAPHASLRARLAHGLPAMSKKRIPGLHTSSDEIGQIAQAAEIFRTNAKYRVRLEQEPRPIAALANRSVRRVRNRRSRKPRM